MKLRCKKCGKNLVGIQMSYCSKRCSRRHLKSLWQKRKRDVVNEAKRKWRGKTKRFSDNCWYMKSQEKVQAHREVHKALKLGIIKKLSCEVCKN